MSRAEADEDDLAERLLDLVVYAPLGLALEAKDLLPKLAERGRGQVALTRLAGTVAARQSQHEAEKLVDDIRTSISSFLGLDGGDAPADEAESRSPDDSAELPIPGYATMTAVQVIPLLANLDAGELDAIETFERANRARVTVLNRIAQRRDA